MYGLLAVPKNIKIDLEEFIGKEKRLPVAPNKALNKSKDVAEDLNQVSEAIQEMANVYKESTSYKDLPEKENNKQIFITELLNNLESYKENMLYDDISKENGEIINEIFERLLDKQEIERKDLLQIFANCNSYIVDFEDQEISDRLETDITEMVRMINISYKVSKSNFVWQKKMNESKKIMEKQLNEVSKAIQKMAKGIEKDIKTDNQNNEQFNKERTEIIEVLKQKGIEVQDIMIRKEGRYIIEIYLNEILELAKIEVIQKILTKILNEKIVLNEDVTIGQKLNFLSADKYQMAFSTCEKAKNRSEASGDSILNIRLKDGKYLIALSDGMGTGKIAKESSEKVLRMLENLLLSGFDKKTSLNLINTALENNQNETFATLDIAIVDLYEGNIEFIKSAACPTYIKSKKTIQIIKSSALPAGIIGNLEDGKSEISTEVFDKDINSGDIMMMCSDGVLDANIEYKNKELWLKYVLEDLETTNTKKIADLVLNEAIDNNFGVIKDDMTVIVCKFVEA